MDRELVRERVGVVRRVLPGLLGAGLGAVVPDRGQHEPDRPGRLHLDDLRGSEELHRRLRDAVGDLLNPDVHVEDAVSAGFPRNER